MRKTQTTSLRDYPISGVSSMVRDLSLLSAQPAALESDVLRNAETLNPTLFYDAPIITAPGQKLTIGDVILFQLGDKRGAYPDMETLWGGRTKLVPGRNYVGVLCERLSSKLITAEFEKLPRLGSSLDLQLIAQAGGIGLATGYSPALEKENGTGVPADVTVIGVVGHNKNPANSLNIIQHTPLHGNDVVRRKIPHILCVGTATDVGKTTVMGALIKSFSSRFVCTAIKASGTGWYEDSQIHVNHGALLGLSYMAAGLPTTYNLPKDLYLSRINRVLDMASSPHDIPSYLLPPALRGQTLKPPDMVFIEHGGDLIEANIPSYLEDRDLMSTVKAIVVCSESAVSFRGALAEITEHAAHANHLPRVYANMPLMNPQGFMRRMESLLDRGVVSGVVDVNKPDIPPGRDRRLQYASAYDQILTPQNLMRLMA